MRWAEARPERGRCAQLDVVAGPAGEDQVLGQVHGVPARGGRQGRAQEGRKRSRRRWEIVFHTKCIIILCLEILPC